MNVLVTGAGGFLGQAVTTRFASDPAIDSLTLTDVIEPPIPSTPADERTRTPSKPTIQTLKADLTSAKTCRDLLLSNSFSHIYLLHGIMSGAAEANLPLGQAVNVDTVRNLLDVIRDQRSGGEDLGQAEPPPIRVVYTSSLAVYGGLESLHDTAKSSEPPVISELTIPLAQSSYGTQKLMCEGLLNDFSRRGIIDACIVRLPTIIVRPGKPSGAASSFCSDIVREPLNGRKAVLPVARRDLKLWVCSTRTVVRNLARARDVSFDAARGPHYSRVVNLPGVTVTVQEILGALKAIAGEEALERVEVRRDGTVERIIASWPMVFDTKKALDMGFHKDTDLATTIRGYMEDYSEE